MFHHQMKHLEIRQKYPATRRNFQLFSQCFIYDETVCQLLDITSRVSCFDILYPILLSLYSLFSHRP